MGSQQQEEETVAKKSRAGRIVKYALLTLLALVLVLTIVVFALWHNEIAAVLSIKQIALPDEAHMDGSIYEMTVPGGYYFDAYLDQGGAATDAELIAFITGNITKGLIPMEIGESDIGCSSFTATTDDNGHRVFGRNYDFSRTNTCIVHTDPGGGRHASVSTIDLQFIGIEDTGDVDGLMDKVRMLAAPYVPLDGVNDAGVACGIYMSYQGPGEGAVPTAQDTDKPDLTSTTMLRLILDYADDVDEAIELVEQYDLHDSANTSFHYMVADAKGNSAVLEWVNATDRTDNDGTRRQLKVNRCDEAGYQTVTNYILAEGYYDGQDEEDQKGLDRNEYLRARLAATRGHLADADEAMALLRDVGRRTWKPDGEGITVHSVVYDLTDCTATWVGNEHYGEATYTKQLSVKDQK